jgi:hypothetical protein
MPNGILQDQDIDEGSSNLRESTQSRAATDHEQNDAMQQCRKFTLFPKFPLEMRRMIWLMSFEGKEVSLDICLDGSPAIGLLFFPCPAATSTNRMFGAPKWKLFIFSNI